MTRLPCFWLSSYVARHHLSVEPQSGEKDQFNCAVYYIILNSYCEAQRASIFLNIENRVRGQN
jgi:hypothetical protein